MYSTISRCVKKGKCLICIFFLKKTKTKDKIFSNNAFDKLVVPLIYFSSGKIL